MDWFLYDRSLCHERVQGSEGFTLGAKMRVYQWNSDTSITQILHKKTSIVTRPV